MDNLEALSGLFLQVLALCRRAGLVKLGHVALDGTKVRANASRHKAMSYGRMKEKEVQLAAEVEELLPGTIGRGRKIRWRRRQACRARLIDALYLQANCPVWRLRPPTRLRAMVEEDDNAGYVLAQRGIRRRRLLLCTGG